jgi:hypothetical protein
VFFGKQIQGLGQEAVQRMKCGSCGEDLIQHPSTGVFVHRFNMISACPKQIGQYIQQYGSGPQNQQQYNSAIEQLRQMQEELKKRQAEAQAEAEAIRDGLKKSRQEQDQNKDQNKDGQGQSEERKDDWLIRAAHAVNEFWRTRVQARGYAPTDKEVANVVAKFAKGRVSQTDQAVISFETAETLQALTMDVIDVWKGALVGNPVDVGLRKRLGAKLKRLAVCKHCHSSPEFLTTCKVDPAGNHSYRVPTIDNELNRRDGIL